MVWAWAQVPIANINSAQVDFIRTDYARKAACGQLYPRLALCAICPYNGGRLSTNLTRRSSPTLYAGLSRKLGVSSLRSDKDLAALVQKRLSPAAIDSLIRSGLSDAEVYDLIVPRRTLAHRIAKHQSLSKEESDKAVRVARVTAAAEQVFGEPERAWRWLRKPKRQFDSKSPIEMLASEAGARLVEELIIQIDNGLAA
jgi:putative toxin-antitoxin system antitoxin component (TIGR02293 family)